MRDADSFAAVGRVNNNVKAKPVDARVNRESFHHGCSRLEPWFVRCANKPWFVVLLGGFEFADYRLNGFDVISKRAHKRRAKFRGDRRM